MAQPSTDDRKLTDLAEVYDLLKSDAVNLLRDLLRGVSMWGTTALMALFLTCSWIILAAVITIFGHPYGSPPNGVDYHTVLDALYASYAFAGISAIICGYLFSRYYLLRKKYTRLFKLAEKLTIEKKE